jgi:hypothetical protein
MTRLALIALVAATTATAASSQGFDGAYISLETLGYSSDSDLGQVTYSGGAQVSFGAIAASADFTTYGFEALGGDGTALTFHGLYTLPTGLQLGGFYGFDTYDDLDTNYYGAEVQAFFAGATVEAFLGNADGDLASGTMFGLSGGYDIGPIGLEAGYAMIDDAAGTNRLSLTGEWNLGLGPTVYAEWGTVSGASDEDYLALGVRLGIGQNGGTTFGPRSSFEIAPGF